MKNFGMLLNDGLQSDFITTLFPILRIVFVGLIFISAVVLIITVLMQSNDSSGGTNVLSGVRESYYSENKAHTRDGRLRRLTVIASSVIAIASVLYFVSLLINKS